MEAVWRFSKKKKKKNTELPCDLAIALLHTSERNENGFLKR
jgi:hypothetical protein